MTAADVRMRVLRKLSVCRGQRAYGVSLLDCLPDEPRTERRLHNVCVTLYRDGLIERQKGMYCLTAAGAQASGMK
ncbi:hypothetical protein [Undibacterium sp. KW1]|uniref:hypothetical protein n=1 Tax=Undibacterium sp. KW1 TaxID=2058624 RepID=UPI00138A14D5|nr:hypothetical protein [Undibacterium sp. KW1]